jgi:hypothetical protein
MVKVHIVYNNDSDVIGIIEAEEKHLWFYTWLHVAEPDLHISEPMEIQTHDEFVDSLVRSDHD